MSNALTLATRRWGCNGRTVTGLRLVGMMVGPGELLPIKQVAAIEIGGTVTVLGNVWTRLPDPFEPIVAVENE